MLLISAYFIAVFKVNGILEILAYSGFSILALGFAFLSVKLARESDKRMKTLAEDTFLAITGTLEDRRLILKNKRLQFRHLKNIDVHSESIEYQLLKIDYINDLSFSIWKCYTDLQRIELFKDYMKKNEHLEDKQNKIIEYLKYYYIELIEGINLLEMQIHPDYKKHIRWMFNIVEDFDVYPISIHKNDLNELMEKLQR